MTDNEVMTLKKALFILRQGSAEGEHKYFEAIEIIENEITHQKAEIERYEKSFAEVLKSIKEVQILVVKDIAKAKAEAVKEFAERLKDTKFKHGNDYMIYAENIDNLVKEMVGANNGCE